MKRTLVILAVLVMALGIVAPTQARANPENADEIQAAAATKAAQSREDKAARIAEIKAGIEARKIELQTARCERREARLKLLMPRLANSANRVKSVIDKAYERVTGFYESGQLTVQNYQELVEAIELAKANAESSLEVVANYQFEFDCDIKGVGQQLDAYRTAIKEARDSLKEYRKAVVELVKGLKSEHARANREDDSEDTTETY